MDGGVVEFEARRTSIEVDVRPGAPRAWIAFLVTLAASAATLLLIVTTVVPDEAEPAHPFSLAELVLDEESAVLREDIARLTAERDALAQERRRLAREVTTRTR